MVCVRGPDVEDEDEVSGVLRILSFLKSVTSARVRGLGSGIRIGKTTRTSIEAGIKKSINEIQIIVILCYRVVLTHCDKDDQGEDREPVDTVIRLSFHIVWSWTMHVRSKAAMDLILLAPRSPGE
jgi:hypothetical protein